MITELLDALAACGLRAGDPLALVVAPGAAAIAVRAGATEQSDGSPPGDGGLATADPGSSSVAWDVPAADAPVPELRGPPTLLPQRPQAAPRPGPDGGRVSPDAALPI